MEGKSVEFLKQLKKQLQVALEKEGVMRCGPGPVIVGDVLCRRGRKREKINLHPFIHMHNIYRASALMQLQEELSKHSSCPSEAYSQWKNQNQWNDQGSIKFQVQGTMSGGWAVLH